MQKWWKFAIEMQCAHFSLWFSLYLFFLTCNLGAFEDADVTHVEGEVNPVRDFDIISEELRLKDVATMEKAFDSIKGPMSRADKKAKVDHVSGK